MRSKFNFKEFLSRNKIYFEIFEKFFLGFMAIVISLTQTIIACEDIDLKKKDAQPILRIATEVSKLKDPDYYDTEILRLFNDGKPVKKSELEIFSFLFLEIQDYKNRKDLSFSIPISDMFAAEFKRQSSTGELYACYTVDNNRIIATLSRSTMDLGTGMTFYSLRRYFFVSIKYDDLNGDHHEVLLDDNGVEVPVEALDKFRIPAKTSFGNRSFSIEEMNEPFIKSLIKNLRYVENPNAQ